MANNVTESNNKPVTMETLMAAVDAILEKSNARLDAIFAASDAKFKQEQKASDEKFKQEQKESDAKYKQELAASNARIEAIFAASDAKYKQEQAEASARFDKEYQKLMDSQANTEKLFAETRKQIGGMGNNNGALAQEFFFNAIFYGTKKLFGQEFDEAFSEIKRKSKKTGIEVEYDIVLLNCQSACIVEVKYKADTEDVTKTLKKEKTFRINFPEHADKKLYLALASMSFDSYVEDACKRDGIAVIKQLGKTIEIFDEHLKVF